MPLMIGSWGRQTIGWAGTVADEIKVGGTANPDLVPLVREWLGAGSRILTETTGSTPAQPLTGWCPELAAPVGDFVVIRADVRNVGWYGMTVVPNTNGRLIEWTVVVEREEAHRPSR